MKFPDTHLSLLESLAADDPSTRAAAADLLCRAYRGPVLDTLRWRWGLGNEDAEDLVQDFFADLFAKEWLARFDPAKGRFRTFLRVCADRFAGRARRDATRQKRGGGSVAVSLDDADPHLPSEAPEVDARFREEWIRSVLSLAVNGLEAESASLGRQVHFELFCAYDLTDLQATVRPTYAELAARHGLSDTEVINHLAWARRRFRSVLLDVLRRLAGSEAEFREDVRELLGVDA